MVNSLTIAIFLTFICTGINGRWIISKTTEGVVPTTESYWVIKVSEGVNRPTFPAYIRFYNKHTAKSEYEIDCSKSQSVLHYNGNGIGDVIFLTKDHIWEEGDYYITLDEGVLYSDHRGKSPEQLSPKFWEFRVVSPPRQ